jgi:hypothetical protein
VSAPPPAWRGPPPPPSPHHPPPAPLSLPPPPPPLCSRISRSLGIPPPTHHPHSPPGASVQATHQGDAVPCLRRQGGAEPHHRPAPRQRQPLPAGEHPPPPNQHQTHPPNDWNPWTTDTPPALLAGLPRQPVCG